MRTVFPRFREEHEGLPRKATGTSGEFYLDNGQFGGTDALAYYCMIRHFRPRRIVEVGAGFSSRLAALAGRRNGDTKLICIEPHPDRALRSGFPGLAGLIVEPV